MSDPNSEFQPPPPPSTGEPAGAATTMSTKDTITGIFFEPSAVFESLRVRPRFLVATIICIVFFMAFQLSFFQKVGYERVVRESIENGPRADQMTPEQKDAAIRMQGSPIVKVITLASTPIVFAIIFVIGAAFYLLGSMLMAKQISFKQALAVWAYSSLPPIVLAMVINVILVFLKSPDDYDIVSASRRGLVRANLSFLSDARAAPILYTLMGAFDLFAFYGLFLAALGLRKVGKMSSGSAWSVTIGIFILGLVIKVALAGLFGQGM